MFCNRIFILKIICFALIAHAHLPAEAKTVQKRGVMDNVNEGLKYAGQMFGINTAADVANLVAKAFSSNTNRKPPDIMSIFQQKQPSDEHTSSQEQHNAHSEAVPPPGKEEVNFDFNTTKMVANILRMIGFDASKLGALAINALIMIAQAIGNTIMSTTKRNTIVNIDEGGRFFGTGPDALHEPNDHQPRELRDGSPIDWFLKNPNKKMKKLLNDVNDRNLSDKVTKMIENLEDESGQAACLKMLMCKSSPFIWGMQKSLKKRLGQSTDDDEKESEEGAKEDSALNVKAFFKHLPSISEYREHGEECQQRYKDFCNTTTLYNNN